MRIEREFAVLAALALLVTVYAAVALSDVADVGGADPSGYLVMARGMLEGEGFVTHTVKQYDWIQPEIIGPDYVEPPGASVPIAALFFLFGESPLVGKLFTLIAALFIIPLLVYGLARTWELRPGASLAAGMFALFYPVSFFSHLYALSDDPMVMWLLAGLLCFFRARGRIRLYALSGVFLSFALMTKYTAAFVWVALGLYGPWAIWKRSETGLSLRNLTIVFVVAILVASPLLGRNIAYFGHPLFTVTATQTWTIGYEEPGTKYDMFFWDEGPATLSWALKEHDLSDLARKYHHVFKAFIIEEGLFVLLFLAGLALWRRPQSVFILAVTGIFFAFFLLLNHYEGRYFLLLHALWSIPIAYLFFRERAGLLFRAAGALFIILLAVFVLSKFTFAEVTPYRDTEFTHGRLEFAQAVIEIVPPGEPVMSYYPRQTDYLTRHPVLMQLDEDPGTLLRILNFYNTSYLECGKKSPHLNNDSRFSVVYDSDYDLCRVNWDVVMQVSPPVPADINVTQDWSISRFRPQVSPK